MPQHTFLPLPVGDLNTSGNWRPSFFRQCKEARRERVYTIPLKPERVEVRIGVVDLLANLNYWLGYRLYRDVSVILKIGDKRVMFPAEDVDRHGLLELLHFPMKASDMSYSPLK